MDFHLKEFLSAATNMQDHAHFVEEEIGLEYGPGKAALEGVTGAGGAGGLEILSSSCGS